jgi:hypothetical protein
MISCFSIPLLTRTIEPKCHAECMTEREGNLIGAHMDPGSGSALPSSEEWYVSVDSSLLGMPSGPSSYHSGIEYPKNLNRR